MLFSENRLYLRDLVRSSFTYSNGLQPKPFFTLSFCLLVLNFKYNYYQFCFLLQNSGIKKSSDNYFLLQLFAMQVVKFIESFLLQF